MCMCAHLRPFVPFKNGAQLLTRNARAKRRHCGRAAGCQSKRVLLNLFKLWKHLEEKKQRSSCVLRDHQFSSTKFPNQRHFFLLSLLYFKADRDSFCPPKMACTLESAALAAYLHMLSAASQRHVLLSVRNRQRCIFWLKGITAVVSGLDALPPQKILSLFRKYAASEEEGLWEMSDALAHSSMGGLRGLIVRHWFMLFHIFHIWMPGIFNPPRSWCSFTTFILIFSCSDSHVKQ